VSEDQALQENRPRKGVAIKLFGVALIFLGVLDSMLSWRGGFALEGGYALMMAFGVFLYALGAIRDGSRP
jgi:hypothetical protein